MIIRIFKIGAIGVAGLLLIASCARQALPSLEINKNKRQVDSATFDYVYGEALRQKTIGNYSEALKYLEECMELNPVNDAPYYQVALISSNLGDIKRGKKYSIKASELDPENLWYLNLTASLYYQEGNTDSALYYYEKAIKQYPENIDMLLTLASVYSEKGYYDKANEIYEDFEKKYGINERTTIFYIKNLYSSGKYDSAEEKLLILLKDDPENITLNGILAENYRKKGEKEKALEIYNKLMEKDSTNPQTLLSLCDFMIAEKQYENIFELLNVIALNEKIPLEGKITILTKIIDAKEIISKKEKEFEIVLMVFERSEKNKDVIYLIRPEFYNKLGKKEKAIERLEEIISERQENYFTWEKLLLLYSETSNYDKLLIRGKECATIFNMSYPAKVLYASAAVEKGLFDIALEELRKAKILAGDQSEMVAQVMTMEADIYYRKKEYEISFGIFDEALKNNPEDLIILNNYAYYLAEQNTRLKDAERMINFVIGKEKENTTFLDTYAWVLFKKGDKKEAARIMEKIISGSKDGDPEWFEHYAYIMKSMKKYEIAEEYFRKAYELNPGKGKLLNELENCGKR